MRRPAPSDTRVSPEAPRTPIAVGAALLCINAIPLLHGLSLLTVLLVPWGTVPQRVAVALATLYLLPPLLARWLRRVFPLREGLIYPATRSFLVWLALLNLQVLFCRLPFLDELLRLVPGLYSAWLRLWGARIGRLTYWAAGTTILERPFLNVGDNVIFGAGVRLNAHVLAKDDQGRTVLYFGAITIGDRAVIGGYSLLTAGVEIAAEEETMGFLRARPFTYWKNGRRADRPIPGTCAADGESRSS